jgi:uncharacterized protein (UPF0262 family)
MDKADNKIETKTDEAASAATPALTLPSFSFIISDHQKNIIISSLVIAFADQEPIVDYTYGPHRVDLYLQKARVVINIDRTNEPNYDAKKEVECMQTLTNALRCTWANCSSVENRSNTPGKYVSLFDIIAKIIYNVRLLFNAK